MTTPSWGCIVLHSCPVTNHDSPNANGHISAQAYLTIIITAPQNSMTTEKKIYEKAYLLGTIRIHMLPLCNTSHEMHTASWLKSSKLIRILLEVNNSNWKWLQPLQLMVGLPVDMAWSDVKSSVTHGHDWVTGLLFEIQNQFAKLWSTRHQYQSNTQRVYTLCTVCATSQSQNQTPANHALPGRPTDHKLSSVANLQSD